MDYFTIQRYQPGGDIYASLLSQFGKSAADHIAAAAMTADETQVNAAIVEAKYGAPKETSTAKIFGTQMVTDPLAAPLEGANNLIGNSVWSFLKNPWVVALAGVIIFGAMGGFRWLGAKLFGGAK